MEVIHIFLAIATLLSVGCNSTQQKDTDLVKQTTNTRVDTSFIDKVVLKETFKQEDTAYNEYLAGRLKPIRENFKRINSITQWISIDSIEIDGSTEGGEAIFYYGAGRLEKIVTRHFGETFQQLSEYYLLHGQISFVFERSVKYNRPIYYDSASMKENNDNQAFDFDKSGIAEDRSYFEKGKLIHQVNNQDCGSPFSGDYLTDEQKRIIADFDRLKTMKKSS